MKRKIEITKADIKKGWAGAVRDCPIARAIKRSLRIDTIHVGQSMASFDFHNRKFSLFLPSKVTSWIGRFDNEKNVKPFTFILRSNPV